MIAGERQPPAVHAITAAINAALGSQVVCYSEPVVFEAGTASHEPAIGGARACSSFSAAIRSGRCRSTFARVPSLYVGLHANETARACRYVVPAQHALERWDLARAFDGTLTPIQPLIEPLFDGRSVADVLEAMLGESRRPRAIACNNSSAPRSTRRSPAAASWELHPPSP